MSDAPDVRVELAAGLAPVAADLDRQKRDFARRYGLALGVDTLPRVALLLAFGFYLASLAGGHPFPPFVLPLLLPLVPLATALQLWLRPPQTSTGEAAVRADRAHGTCDRLSAALEFSGRRDPGRFHRAAIADGLACLRATRPTGAPLLWEPPRPRLAPPIIAVLIACLPMVVPLPGGRHAAPGSTPTDEAAAPAGAVAAERAARPRSAAEPSEPPRPAEVGEGRSGEGRGTGGSAGAARPDREAAAAGELASGDAPPPSTAGSGAGAGSAPAGAAPGEGGEVPLAGRRGRAAATKARATEHAGADAAASSATTGGPAGTGARTTAVGHARQGADRADPHASDDGADDAEREDERAEVESRGGAMPLGRDRDHTAGRELAIRGDGPPQDGRGGPTPPKKSRGAASLVLGIRLPDQVRGQPNPGTAKTSVGPVAPRREPAAAAPATAADPGGAQTPQPTDPRDRELAPVIDAYHDLLRRAREVRRAVEPKR